MVYFPWQVCCGLVVDIKMKCLTVLELICYRFWTFLGLGVLGLVGDLKRKWLRVLAYFATDFRHFFLADMAVSGKIKLLATLWICLC